MRGEARVALLARPRACATWNVRVALALQLHVVRPPRPRRRYDLGDRVREAGAAAERSRGPRRSSARLPALRDHDQRADASPRPRRRRRSTNDERGSAARASAPRGDAHEGAVLEERGVRARRTACCFERRRSGRGAPRSRSASSARSAARLSHARRRRAARRRRQLGREAAVHEHETAARDERRGERVERRRARRRRAARRARSGCARAARGSCSASPRRACVGKPRSAKRAIASRAQRREPRPARRGAAPPRSARVVARRSGRARPRARSSGAAAPLEPAVALLLELERQLLAARLCTMRPSASTCTRSGTM